MNHILRFCLLSVFNRQIFELQSSILWNDLISKKFPVIYFLHLWMWIIRPYCQCIFLVLNILSFV